MATSAVNFFQPGTDASVDVNQLQRQRLLADALVKQGQTTPQGQMVSGHYVAPNALSYVSQLASALGGAYKERQSDADERGLVQKLAAQRGKEATDFMTAANGTPASTQEVPTNAPSATNPNGNLVEAAPVTTPAVAPDQSKALAIALQSQNPMLQGVGGDMMKQQMMAAQLKNVLGGAASGPPAAPGTPGTPGAPAAAGGAGPGLLGSGPGQVDPRVVQLASLGPVGEKLAGYIQDANKPIPMREGDLVVPDGNGGFKSAFQSSKLDPGMVPVRDGQGQVTDAKLLPSYAQNTAQLAGAKASGPADYEMTTVDTPQGPKMMTRLQARQLAGGGQQGAPAAPQAAPQAPPVAPQGAPAPVVNGGGPVNGQPIPNPMAPRPQDSDRAAIFSQERQQIAQRLQQAQQAGDSPGLARAQQDAVDLEKEIKSNKIPLPPMPVPGVTPGGPGIPLQGEAQKAYSIGRAKDYATQAATAQQTGRAAATTLGNLNQLEQLYKDPNVANGALAENVSGMKNIASSFGVDVKGLSSEQAARSLTNQMALQMRSTADGGGMPGSMSDGDRKFLTSMTPDLSRSPEGRAQIMSTSRQIAQRQIQVADLAAQYEQQHGQLDVGFDRQLAEFANSHPLFSGQNAAPPKAATSNMQDLASQELARRRAKAGG